MKNRNREMIINNVKGITKSIAEKMASEAKMSAEKLAEYAKKKQEAEQAKFQQAQALSQIRELEIISNDLRQMIAYALDQVPAHQQFYDHVNRYSLRVKYDNVCYYIVLQNKHVADDISNYRHFNKSLQICFDQLHKDALDALYGRIIQDADKWRDQQLRFNETGVFTGKTDVEFCNEYTNFYKQWRPYLYQIKNIATVPIAGGAKISFQATLHDVGLNPENYFDVVNRCL